MGRWLGSNGVTELEASWRFVGIAVVDVKKACISPGGRIALASVDTLEVMEGVTHTSLSFFFQETKGRDAHVYR
jgi:hypothetical protein